MDDRGIGGEKEKDGDDDKRLVFTVCMLSVYPEYVREAKRRSDECLSHQVAELFYNLEYSDGHR